MTEPNKRTIQQIKYFCEVMVNESQEDFTELTETERSWQLGYTQAMKHVLLWIETSNVIMVPKSEYEKVSEE